MYKNSQTERISGLGNKVIDSIVNGYFFMSTGLTLGYWDVCAGHALVKEVGGNCLFSNGEEIIYPCSFEDRLFTKPIILSSNNDQLSEFLKKLNENKIAF